jgi:hypothetical protein
MRAESPISPLSRVIFLYSFEFVQNIFSLLFKKLTHENFFLSSFEIIIGRRVLRLDLGSEERTNL